MAAAEARAAWQRANRCFVQEDAKRAPKLACCPSTSMSQNDLSIGSTCSQDHGAPSFLPVSWTPMNPNLSPDIKWWLQLQPNFGYQKEYICEQLSSLEEEFDEEAEITIQNSKVSVETLLDESVDVDPNDENHLDSPWMVSCKNQDSERKSGIKSATDYSQEPIKHKGDQIYKDEELLDWKTVDGFISKKQEKAYSHLETPWVAVNKTEPWWRITDKDELASLVAQKSVEHIENCDLPKPSQTVHVSMDPFYSVENLDTAFIFSSPLGPKLRAGSTNDYSENSYNTKKDDNSSSYGERGYMSHNSEKLYGQAQGYATRKRDQPESAHTSGSLPEISRAQLLEALQHSQTRARQAEMAAQKACNEKEHIVKLLFRQASYLFACKQWLQILQIESLCLQLKVKDDHMPTTIPVLPWIPLKPKPSSKDKSTPTRRKERKKNTCGICKSAFLFALGLGLAGAGLLFGWTLGWLLPNL